MRDGMESKGWNPPKVSEILSLKRTGALEEVSEICPVWRDPDTKSIVRFLGILIQTKYERVFLKT